VAIYIALRIGMTPPFSHSQSIYSPVLSRHLSQHALKTKRGNPVQFRKSNLWEGVSRGTLIIVWVWEVGKSKCYFVMR